MDREFAIVVFGATGFVGKIISRYLAEHSPSGLHIALAGRSHERLRVVRDSLPPSAREWELLELDAQDQSACDALARRTRVVLTLVGPYVRYGIQLVTACARQGTHYVDLTGEVFFVKYCSDQLSSVAAASGAKIVNSCGFDSVPSDICVLLLHERAAADGAGELLDTTLAVTSMKGTASGGTIDSMRQQAIQVSENPSLRSVKADPYCLSPARMEEPSGLGDESDFLLPRRSEGEWVAPFIMGPFNSRIVRRSNALLGWQYGRKFRYYECKPLGKGVLALVKGFIVSAVSLAFGLGMRYGYTRALLDRVLPKPGEGPSEEQMRTGEFRVRTTTTTTSGARYAATMGATGDPGYSRTSVMISECALALATDEGLPKRSGVLTPATAIGSRLAERLRAQGFDIDVNRI